LQVSAKYSRAGEFCLVAKCELGPDPLHVGIDRVGADAEAPRDLTVGVAAGNVVQYLFFTAR
jgi:hypothetical protein